MRPPPGNWLGPADDLPVAPSRVLVAGTSGAGKSTLAQEIAAVLELPYFELDALFHGPGWTERETFAADVRAAVARPGWVTEYQYAPVLADLIARAELLVWLDLPRRVVMGRVVRRTVMRRVTSAELYNGNHEPPLRRFLTDRDHIIRWAWRTHGLAEQRVRAGAAQRPELPIVRLATPAQAQAWLRGPLTRRAARPA